MGMIIYLDVCCLNRPFDDRIQDRVRIESEAVLSILERCQGGSWILLGSEVTEIEISRIPDNDRRQRIKLLSSVTKSFIIVDNGIERRALELEKLGFKSFDALHIACAEKGKADVLLTTDDGLLHTAFKSKNIINVKVENPVRWLMEEIKK